MLAGKADHRAIGQAGHAQPGHRVSETAAGSHATHTGSASDTGIAVRRIGSGLLVAHVHQFYVIVPQVGENRKCVPAIDCEHVLYFLLFENAADQHAAINSCHQRIPPFRLSARHLPIFSWLAPGEEKQKREASTSLPGSCKGGCETCPCVVRSVEWGIAPLYLFFIQQCLPQLRAGRTWASTAPAGPARRCRSRG